MGILEYSSDQSSVRIRKPRSYDAYGPFIIVGGIAKGHPNEKRSKVQLSFIGH